MVPQDLRYSKEHEWVRIEGGVAVVGITDFAAEQLGDIVFVELPEVGRTVAQGDAVGVIESVKAVSDLFCPVSGDVAEVNGDLTGRPELLNSDPFGAGWLIRVAVSDKTDLDRLLDAKAYEALTATA
jgi:glycine cleavage system H protein